MLGYLYERYLTLRDGTHLVVPQSETPKTFEIPFPPQGLIKRLIVRQVLGNMCAYTVDLYSAQVDAINPPGGSSSEIPAPFVDDLAQIIPQQTANAGVAVKLISDGGYGYQNREGSFTAQVRKIYIKIDPTSPVGETGWEVAIAALTMQPGGH